MDYRWHQVRTRRLRAQEPGVIFAEGRPLPALGHGKRSLRYDVSGHPAAMLTWSATGVPDA